MSGKSQALYQNQKGPFMKLDYLSKTYGKETSLLNCNNIASFSINS